ncbi:hypothetical protein BN946_scf185007.g195 [Trametes cinnabarina]|uniref:Uncharacterized protein n=1 Tax=Pycnoporus cinnabarinus TaxID=5643 RepID=A0A060SFI6_PYCCI|nr:hypothetical protein BN946_scf185007.g195 [Trametes cinnabarina]
MTTLAAGREKLKAKLDFHIMKLICVQGLVPDVIDSCEWKDFMQAANPHYNATLSTTFADVHIPAEVAKIRILQLQFLQQQTHLTLTYDGATTQKPQSVYTIHITTQIGRLAIPRKQVKFDIKLLQENSVASIKFEQELTWYTTILAPITRSIKSLKTTDTTAADVYIFWLGIASTLRKLFAWPQEQSGIPSDLTKKIIRIINKRYKAIIDESPTDVYFVTFFLDPDYSRANILAKPTSILNKTFILSASHNSNMDCLKPPEALNGNADSSKSPETSNGYVDSTKSSTSDGNTADLEDDSQKVPNPRAYMCIKKFLKELLLAEVKLNTHLLIKQLEEADLAEELREQLLAYVRREYL